MSWARSSLPAFWDRATTLRPIPEATSISRRPAPECRSCYSKGCRRANSTARTICVTRSNQPQRLEARVPVLADDDVIVHRDAERLRHVDDRLGHLDVGA